MSAHRLPIGLGALALVLGAAPVAAHDPATTQAGLVEKAALASDLHRVLIEQFGQPMGLLEPLRLQGVPAVGSPEALLERALATLDPAEGYRPDRQRGLSALGWLGAGAVIEEVPAERGRHHFFDPTTGRGLDDGAHLAGTVHALRLAIDGPVGVRGVATGSAFDLTGKPATEWLVSPENALSVVQLLHWVGRAGSGETAAVRNDAVARALLCAGAISAVVADTGDPAHARNDFRTAYRSRGEVGPWDERSAYELAVARAYGRSAVPEPAARKLRPNLAAFISAPDGQGLADRTARAFFSAGTVPEPVFADRQSTPRSIADRARLSLRHPHPTVSALSLPAGPGATTVRYLRDDKGRRILAYRREPAQVRFFLDEAVYADTAAAQLPEIGGYLIGVLEHLFRARVSLSLAGDAALTVRLAGPVKSATAEIFLEDAQGRRTPGGTPVTFPPGASAPTVTFARPAAGAKVAVVVRGEDAAGPLVGLAELRLP